MSNTNNIKMISSTADIFNDPFFKLDTKSVDGVLLQEMTHEVAQLEVLVIQTVDHTKEAEE